MSFQAYLDNIKAKTGKTPEDFKKLAKAKGLLRPGMKAGEIVSWLKGEFGLGHGHAMAIWAVFSNTKVPDKKKAAAKKTERKPASGMTVAANDIDSYIEAQDKEARPGLQKLREVIKSAAPDAEEVISYGMPAFKYHGMLAGFAAGKNHFGFYPWTSRTTEQFKDELAGFKTSKGAIQLPKDKPFPVTLIKKIVMHRMRENIEKENLKKLSKTAKN